MEVKDAIKKKLENNSFKKIKYVYPAMPESKLGEYISGYSNSDGGIILYGVQDGGAELVVKGTSCNMSKLESFISRKFENCTHIKTGCLSYGQCNLFYINIDKSNKTILYDDEMYIMKDSSNERTVPKKVEKANVFLSYCHKDKPIMTLVKTNLEQEKYIDLTVDEDLKYKDDLEEYMKDIKNHDFVISIISDCYLKSTNCMYEVTELMKNDKYSNKLLFIVLSENDRKYYRGEIDINTIISSNLYSPLSRAEYIKYWENEKEKLDNKINEIKNVANISELAQDSKKIASIANHIGEFMKFMEKKLGINFEEMIKNDFDDIKKIIKLEIF